MNYNCFKDFMEKRHYINKKKSLHAGHVRYNYFFFLFFSLLAWKWTFEDLAHGIHIFVLLSHNFLEFRATTTAATKSASLEPCSRESLHLSTSNCFELLRTAASSRCTCAEGIPGQGYQTGRQI